MRRTTTASWSEAKKMWRIDVQKDGQRRSFYSSKPGRAGQREANAKADAWLDDGVLSAATRVDTLLDEYLERVQQTTSFANWRKEEGNVRLYIRPVIGRRRASDLTDSVFLDLLKEYQNKGKNE